MVNTEMLIQELKSKNYSQRGFCKDAGLNKNTFNDKINNKRPFTADEIMLICDVLEITDNKKKCDIFLSKVSHN